MVVLKEIYLYYLDLLSRFVVVLIFFLNDEKLGIEIIFVLGGYNNFFMIEFFLLCFIIILLIINEWIFYYVLLDLLFNNYRLDFIFRYVIFFCY